MTRSRFVPLWPLLLSAACQSPSPEATLGAAPAETVAETVVETVGVAAEAVEPEPVLSDVSDTSDRVSPRDRVERYDVDSDALRSFYDVPPSERRKQRLDTFDAEWEAELGAVDYESLDVEGRIDHHLLAERVRDAQSRRETEFERRAELGEVLAFAPRIVTLEEARWRLEPVDPEAAAAELTALSEIVEGLIARVAKVSPASEEDGDGTGANPEAGASTAPGDQADEDGGGGDGEQPLELTAPEALRAARTVRQLERALDSWYGHYRPYVPAFGWWTEDPKTELSKQLEAYRKKLHDEIAGQKGEDDDPLVGDPIGREALLEDIANELLAYSPEELLAIGEAEFAWCEEQQLLASAELGYGDDWRSAVEFVKGLHVPPGEQDRLVADQANEMIAWLEANELVTIPELAKELWRVSMISRDGQRTLPFAAYGGQEMLVAYPTADMDHDAKLQAMRGNNAHFTRCVTPHELIPGHHLQGFMSQRHRAWRGPFRTPFLVEGWALYWEMLEWDLGWPQGPEDRIGMLFWRKHRAARIIVSLSFHLGLMQPDEMIDFLVERVGLERDGATSEVRRYIGGSYGPLYQCAYMIGGLQLRALHEEVVSAGHMTNREFHDTVLRQGPIPVELVRAALTETELPSDWTPTWRFAGDPLAAEADAGPAGTGR